MLSGKWQLKNGTIKSCVHWIYCAFLVHKIWGYDRKAIYVQLIRSTTRRYFRRRQHHPAWKHIYPKNKPTKNAKNHGNLTKITSQLHEKAINSKKNRIAICCWEECRKGFYFCWRSKAIVEPKSAPQKIKFWGSTTCERDILSRF